MSLEARRGAELEVVILKRNFTRHVTATHPTATANTHHNFFNHSTTYYHARRSLSTVGGHTVANQPPTTVLLSFTFILPPGTV